MKVGGGGCVCVSVSKRGAEKYFFSVTLYNFQNSRAGGGGGGGAEAHHAPVPL